MKKENIAIDRPNWVRKQVANGFRNLNYVAYKLEQDSGAVIQIPQDVKDKMRAMSDYWWSKLAPEFTLQQWRVRTAEFDKNCAWYSWMCVPSPADLACAGIGDVSGMDLRFVKLYRALCYAAMRYEYAIVPEIAAKIDNKERVSKTYAMETAQMYARKIKSLIGGINSFKSKVCNQVTK